MKYAALPGENVSMDLIPYDFHPEARIELRETGRWYADRDLNTSDDFYREVAHAIFSIRSMPDTWPIYLHGTRRYLLDRFPFSVIYREKDGMIQLIALAHHRRKPEYWAKRID